MIHTQELRPHLRRHGPVWVGHFRLGNRSDVEIEIFGDDTGPSEGHLKYATDCVAGLAQLLPDLEAALNAVREDHPLFPPRQSRHWYLEGLSVTGADSHHGEAFFTLDEPGYEYIYVRYFVEIVEGRVGEVHADTH
jgi:hypothetical protein